MAIQNLTKIFSASDFISRINQKTDLIIASDSSLTGSLTQDSGGAPTQIIVLGSDPRVATARQPQPPDLYLLEFVLDSMDNPAVNIHFNISQQDITDQNVIAFDIYRRQTQDINGNIGLQQMSSLDNAGFDKLSNKIKRTGKFSEEKKAIPHISRNMIPQNVLNSNLSNQQATTIATSVSTDTNLTQLTTTLQGSITANRSRSFVKIASLDYSQFTANQQLKQVYVVDKKTVDLFYADKTINYGEYYEYYVVPIHQDGTPGSRSESVQIYITDVYGAAAPLTLTSHQIDETTLTLNATFDKNEKIAKVFIYKKNENEIDFSFLTVIDTIPNDSLSYTDTDAAIGITYSYRVFVENIFGSLSLPIEISTFSSVQQSTSASRSNNLKIPLFSAVQDQNSDFIKVNIFPNDDKVLFYRLDRRDLTIEEKKFSVPSKETTNYGGAGWKTNQFFVTGSQEINFIDDTIDFQHIYQYRVIGYDLALNPTSAAFSLVQALTKKTIRTPTFLTSEIVNSNPIQVKITWQDDNAQNTSKQITDQRQKAVSLLNQRQILQQSQLDNISAFVANPNITAGDLQTFQEQLNLNKEQVAALSDLSEIISNQTSNLFFRVQRRKATENNYDTFPLISGTFLIDEASPDSSITMTDTLGGFTYKIDKFVSGSISENIERPFGLPRYLQPNQTYSYRVACVDNGGNESNYTTELTVLATPQLGDPVQLTAVVLNRKTKPITVKIDWSFPANKGTPDHVIIEKKVDTPYDIYKPVGKSYLKSEFLDFNVETGKTYIYKVMSVNTLGNQSIPAEVRISV